MAQSVDQDDVSGRADARAQDHAEPKAGRTPMVTATARSPYRTPCGSVAIVPHGAVTARTATIPTGIHTESCRAVALITHVAVHPAVRRTLSRLTPTLPHGDVHPGNVLVHGRRA
ncbi:hypothetical protein [Streptomyces sp. NPDC058964]|uniref:hypothetical protein n=1 Tax=Streptomyces sp. NPDC058964 TaxID=3346681 RepID=UPI0036AC722F